MRTPRTPRSWARRAAPIVVVPALLVALTGCSDDGDDGEEAGGEATSASDSASPGEESTPPTITPPDVPTPPVVDDAAGAVADVEWDQSSCSADAGTQTTGGTLTNSTERRTDYLVQISWTNATYDVLGLGFDVVRGARPGQETDWEVEAEVPDGATQCVISVQRGAVERG